MDHGGELTLDCSSYSKVMSGNSLSLQASQGNPIQLSLIFNVDLAIFLIYYRGELMDRLTLAPSNTVSVITATERSLFLTHQQIEINIQLHQHSDPTFLLDTIHNLRLPQIRILCYQSWRDSFLIASIRSRVNQSASDDDTEAELSPVTSDPKLVEDVTRIWNEISQREL